jgi:hypothetical protein
MSSQIGDGAGTSGVGGMGAGEGLARLDSGSLIVGFFLLYKKGLVKEQQQWSKKKRQWKIT